MVTLIIGDNTYAIKQAIDAIISKHTDEFGGDSIAIYDCSELNVDAIPTLLGGVSLFSKNRVVVMREPFKVGMIRDAIERELQHIDDTIHLVLVDSTPDKRTKLYKSLLKTAKIEDLKLLNEAQAIQWLVDEAAKSEMSISRDEAKLLVSLVGIDQWRLSHELEKLITLEDLSAEKIHQIVEPAPQSDVFELLDAALHSKTDLMIKQLKIVESREDPYQFFGLLVMQVFQLALVFSAKDTSTTVIAKETGIHPYPLQKLYSVARDLSRNDMSTVVSSVAQCDDSLKSSSASPWLLIEQALLKIASR